MAAATQLEMRQRILKEVKDSQQTQYESFIDDALRSAILFYSDQKLWFLQKMETVMLLETASSVAVPTDFQLIISLRISVDSRWRGDVDGFQQKTHDQLQGFSQDQTLTGVPRYWALFGSSFYMDKLADDDYALEVSYYKKDTSLPDADGDTSVWYDDGKDLIRNKAIEYFYRDRLHNFEKAADYEIRAERILKQLQMINLKRGLSSGLAR